MPPTKVPKNPPKSIENPVGSPLISKQKKTKKRSYENFSIYLYKILRSVSEEKMGISKKSMLIMNNFLNDMLENIASEAGKLVTHGRKRTLTSQEIRTAIKLLIPGELGEHSNIEGAKALKMYQRTQNKDY